MEITTKQRQKLRSRHWLFRDMRPHIFDRLILLLPHVLRGIEVPKHYDYHPQIGDTIELCEIKVRVAKGSCHGCFFVDGLEVCEPAWGKTRLHCLDGGYHYEDATSEAREKADD